VVDCFNINLRVPNVIYEREVSSVLSNFNAQAQEIQAIAKDFTTMTGGHGVPMKQLLLTVKLAIESGGTKML